LVLTPTQFQIEVPDAVLDDLRARIDATRWPDELRDAGWTYGTDLASLRTLLHSWAHEFDWRALERELNALDHQRIEIDGLAIHFVRWPGREGALPIVLTNGWPSCFLELRKLAPLLVEAGFEPIVPSLPGYGFSARPDRPGMSREAIADLWHRLMTEALGYERFAVHGTDIGASVSSRLGARHPDAVVGVHLSAASFVLPETCPRSAAEDAYAEQMARWTAEEGAYAHQQATKPQTLAYGLTDSPAGLAGWIVEKWRAWSDCGGELERAFTRDEILANLTVYWVTGTIGSSTRLYYDRVDGPTPRVDVPVGISLFHNEFLIEAKPPRELVERSHAVAFWRDHDRGGHFPALEQPARLAADLSEFFGG
jgi:pimeloyl-ACP methyl ester carboxylesterase